MKDYKTALALLEENNDFLKMCSSGPDEFYQNYSQGFDAIETLRELVEKAEELEEKATPKKPHLQGDGFDPSGNIVLDTWICPNCGEHYEVDYDDYDYCPKCGQKIDWSDCCE